MSLIDWPRAKSTMERPIVRTAVTRTTPRVPADASFWVGQVTLRNDDLDGFFALYAVLVGQLQKTFGYPPGQVKECRILHQLTCPTEFFA